MPSERTRPERQYGTEEVQEILQRAASLERQKKLERPMLSANEIETIAKESGLDPEMVKRAISEFEVKGAPKGFAARLAGRPLKAVFEREVDGEITADSHERLAGEIRTAMGSTSLRGHVSTVGRTLTWTGYSDRGVVELHVFPRDGKTVIRLTADTSRLAGGLFGGLIGGLGGGLGVNLAWILPVTAHMPWYAGAAGLAGAVVGAWALARTFYTVFASSLTKRCEGMMDVLEASVRDAVKPKAG